MNMSDNERRVLAANEKLRDRIEELETALREIDELGGAPMAPTNFMRLALGIARNALNTEQETP